MDCEYCTEPFPEAETRCPHCGRPSLFPNVIAANRPEEAAALDARLSQARSEAEARGAVGPWDKFAAAVASAKAVMHRSLGEVTRLAYADTQIYSTFYGRVQAGLELPGNDEWNRLRLICDAIIFGKGMDEIRFAALTLEEFGLENYGECCLTLKEEMISHRASLFEENTIVFTMRHDLRGRAKFAAPTGFRAPWGRLVDLCLAKLGKQLQPGTPASAFSRLLLAPGASSGEDEFVEVHIWGSLTIRSFRRVEVRAWRTAPSSIDLDVLSARLSKFGVELVTP